MLSNNEVKLRKKRYLKAIEFLESFLPEDVESDYCVYRYQELLNEIHKVVSTEEKRIDSRFSKPLNPLLSE